MPDARSTAVLVVEDESIVAHDVQETLRDLGYDAFGVAASAEEAFARASERRPDIVLITLFPYTTLFRSDRKSVV